MYLCITHESRRDTAARCWVCRIVCAMTSLYGVRTRHSRRVRIMHFSRYCFLNRVECGASRARVCVCVCVRRAPKIDSSACVRFVRWVCVSPQTASSLNAKMKFTFSEIFMAFCVFLYALSLARRRPKRSSSFVRLTVGAGTFQC